MQKRKTKSRGNGQGTVYLRGDKYEARVVLGWKLSADGSHTVPVYKTKGGFRTKKEAMLYIPELLKTKVNNHKPQAFAVNMARWRDMYESRISAKTMEGYLGALKYFSPVYYYTIDQISATDLQSCLDNCGHGRRTKQLMKVVAGLVFKYAIDDQQVTVNAAANLYVGDDETTHYAPLDEDELRLIESSGLPYSDYVIAMAYLGHRPTEFFAFRKSDVHRDGDICYLIGGIKTDAGKDRAVTVPPRIQPIIDARLAVPGTDLLFPRLDYYHQGQHTGEFKGFSQMPTRYFNTAIFQPMMAQLGITGKVPYSMRHTYANKMKSAAGDEKDKAGLMGHASYETTRKHYQTTSLKEKKAITDQFT